MQLTATGSHTTTFRPLMRPGQPNWRDMNEIYSPVRRSGIIPPQQHQPPACFTFEKRLGQT